MKYRIRHKESGAEWVQEAAICESGRYHNFWLEGPVATGTAHLSITASQFTVEELPPPEPPKPKFREIPVDGTYNNSPLCDGYSLSWLEEQNNFCGFVFDDGVSKFVSVSRLLFKGVNGMVLDGSPPYEEVVSGKWTVLRPVAVLVRETEATDDQN